VELMGEPTGYRLARRMRAEGPWIADCDDQTIYTTYEAAEQACAVARENSSIRWEIEPMYGEHGD
jgi:hypothetical protein